MNIRFKALKSIFVLLIGAFSGAAFAFFSQLYLARQLGPSEFGVYSAVVSTVMIVAPIAGFGIQGFWLNVFGEEGWRAIRWLHPSYRYIALTFLAVFFVVFFWAVLGPNDHLRFWLLTILAFHAVGQMASEITSGKLQLEEKYTQVALVQSIPHCVRLLLLLAIAFFLNGLDVVKAALAHAIVGILLVLLCAFEIKKMASPDFSLKGHQANFHLNSYLEKKEKIHNVFRRSWPYGSAGVLYFVHFQIASVLLGYMSRPEEAGLYGAGMLVMNAVFILPGVLYQKFLLPKQHRWAQQDRTTFVRVFKLGNQWMIFIGSLLAFFLWAVMPYLVPWMFGAKFQSVDAVLLILIFSVPIRFLATSVGSVLVSRDNMKVKIFCMAAAAFFNLMLCVALIPTFNARGAAMAFLLGELLLLGLYWQRARKVVFST